MPGYVPSVPPVGFDLTSSAIPWAEYLPGTAMDVGLSVEDEAALAALFALRRETLEAQAAADAEESLLYTATPGLYVRDVEQRLFQVLVRDATPPPVIDALHSMLDAIVARDQSR